MATRDELKQSITDAQTAINDAAARVAADQVTNGDFSVEKSAVDAIKASADAILPAKV